MKRYLVFFVGFSTKTEKAAFNDDSVSGSIQAANELKSNQGCVLMAQPSKIPSLLYNTMPEKRI